MPLSSTQPANRRSGVLTVDKGLARKATNLSLPAELLAEARALGVVVSRAAEAGIKAEVERARRERWLLENRAALESSNDFVEKGGLPLARHRMF